MSHENRRTLLTISITLLVGLSIYGIAQGSNQPAIVTESAPQKEVVPEVAAPSVAQQEVAVPSGAVCSST